MSTPLLEVDDLSVEYVTDTRTVRAVDRVTFSIADARYSAWPASPAAASRPSPTRSCGC